MTTPVGRPPASDTPLPVPLAALGVAAVVVMAVGGALVSVLLAPSRIGSTLVPFGVVVAIVVNAVLATLAHGLTGNKGIAGLPVAVFLVAAFALSFGPGGDVLLPGGSTEQTAISYATILGGVLAGSITVMRQR